MGNTSSADDPSPRAQNVIEWTPDLQWVVADKALYNETHVDIHPFPDFLGYKAVNFAFTDTKTSDGCALLWLQIPLRNNSVFYSEDTRKVLLDKLKPNTKYRTGRVQVIGVQFFGDATEVSKMTLAYLQNMGFLESKHDRTFRYEVEKVITVNGVDDVMEGCGKGIHFFTDIDSAKRYHSSNIMSNHSWPVITRKNSRAS